MVNSILCFSHVVTVDDVVLKSQWIDEWQTLVVLALVGVVTFWHGVEKANRV